MERAQFNKCIWSHWVGAKPSGKDGFLFVLKCGRKVGASMELERKRGIRHTKRDSEEISV